jgi:hypothetical protein
MSYTMMAVSKHEIDGAIEVLLRLDPIRRSVILSDLSAQTVSELAKFQCAMDPQKEVAECRK